MDGALELLLVDTCLALREIWMSNLNSSCLEVYNFQADIWCFQYTNIQTLSLLYYSRSHCIYLNLFMVFGLSTYNTLFYYRSIYLRFALWFCID